MNKLSTVFIFTFFFLEKHELIVVILNQSIDKRLFTQQPPVIIFKVLEIKK